MEKIRVGLLGAGNISGVMAETLQQMKEAELYAIASRSLAKAKDFAAEYGVKKYMALMKNWQKMNRWILSMWRRLCRSITKM